MKELGRVRGDAPGPTLLVVGGMHGNEPAGVEAARRLIESTPSLESGELVAFIANVAALEAGVRYLARDLNRQWKSDCLATARAQVAQGDADAESVAVTSLAGAFDDVLARARGPVFAIDLHTSSSPGVPFAIVGPSELDLSFAARFPIPGIVGMKPKLDGVLTKWLGERGCFALAIEGGQNESPDALENLNAVATIGLAAAGLVANPPGLEAARARLTLARGDLPPQIEVVSRHEVRGAFRMEPGFINIQRTAGGTLLAHENGAEIRAPFDGFVLLPLYQPQGQDGFFYGRELP